MLMHMAALIPRQTARVLGVVLALIAAAVTACGGGDAERAAGASTAGGGAPQLTVSAAASLKRAFTAYGDGFRQASARVSFAGSDELAAQIEQGIRPDVFAAANTKLPDQLYARGLVEKPTVFAGNRLVLAVPAAGARVGSLEDLQRDGVTIAIGSQGVPVGSYTRTVLERLPAAQRAAVPAHVRPGGPPRARHARQPTPGAGGARLPYP